MTDERRSSMRPRRIGQVWVRKEADEAAIYDPSTGALHLLNPSALAIWELCDGDTRVDEMTAAVSELTSMTPERAMEEVRAAITALSELGLVIEQV